MVEIVKEGLKIRIVNLFLFQKMVSKYIDFRLVLFQIEVNQSEYKIVFKITSVVYLLNPISKLS